MIIKLTESMDLSKSTYQLYVDSEPVLTRNNITDNQALKEIVAFINTLSSEEKALVALSWYWLDEAGDESDIVVSIYGPNEGDAYTERVIGNWPEAEKQIKAALNISLADNLSGYVYIWNMYINPKDEGTWTSAKLQGNKWEGYVFSTEEDAFNGGLLHLRELYSENELIGGSPEDYTIDFIKVPMSDVSIETLKFSNLI